MPPGTALWTSVKVALVATAWRWCSARSPVCAAALPVLRAQRALVPDHPAHRPARHRHRDRAAQHVRPPRHGISGSDGRHRPRHVLRRGRLQQRRWPGCDGRRRTSSRRRPTSGPRAADLPVRHLPADPLGAAGRRHPGLRPELRRDRRHHVHRRLPGIETLPQWILNNFSRPNNVPLVNVVATVVMVVSIPLAWLAQRLRRATRLATGH